MTRFIFVKGGNDYVLADSGDRRFHSGAGGRTAVLRAGKGAPTAGTEVERVGALIRRGAFTFLKREYRALSVFCAAAGAAIFLLLPRPSGRLTPRPFTTRACWFHIPVRIGSLGIRGGCRHLGGDHRQRTGCLGGSEGHRARVRGGIPGRRGDGHGCGGGVLAGAAVVHLLAPESAEYVIAFSFGASSLALFAKAGAGSSQRPRTSRRM